MKKEIISLLLFLWSITAETQTLVINVKDSNCTIHMKTLRANGKTCLVVNYIANDFIENKNQIAKPLIVLKIFDFTIGKISDKPSRQIELSDYIKEKVIPKLGTDMFLRIETLETANTNTNIQVFDSLIVDDGKSFELITPLLCGECELNFYNEYVYRKNYGVIAFKSKYLFKRKSYDQNLEGPIGESKEYYYFR